jgi:putative photosynthetic complex assembly protein
MITLSALARDRHEKLAWQLAGGLLAGLVVLWSAGYLFHANRPAGTSPLAATADVLRADAVRPTAIRDLRFVESGRDLIARDAAGGDIVRLLDFQKDGFVVSIVRSLERERKRLGVAANEPYRLTRWNNGQVLLEDPATGSQTEFSAFGPTNVEAFARLLAAPAGKSTH